MLKEKLLSGDEEWCWLVCDAHTWPVEAYISSNFNVVVGVDDVVVTVHDGGEQNPG